MNLIAYILEEKRSISTAKILIVVKHCCCYKQDDKTKFFKERKKWQIKNQKNVSH